MNDNMSPKGKHSDLRLWSDDFRVLNNFRPLLIKNSKKNKMRKLSDAHDIISRI